MLIGVVSDTHGHVENTLRGVRMLETFAVEQVLHCGDIGSTDVVALFDAWPTHFVLGNVDGNEDELAAAICTHHQSFYGPFGELTLCEKRVALLHSDDQRRFRETINSDDWDLVCYGHTHQSESHRVGKTMVLNPGALYRARQHSIAIVNLGTMEIEIVAV